MWRRFALPSRSILKTNFPLHGTATRCSLSVSRFHQTTSPQRLARENKLCPGAVRSTSRGQVTRSDLIAQTRSPSQNFSMESKAEADTKINELFDRFKERYPDSLRDEHWYLTASAALVGSGLASHCGSLYTYLIQQQEYQTSVQRQGMIRRLREGLIKCIILNGIPAVIEALMSIAKLERDEDKDYTFVREHWQRDAANRERGLKTLEFLYRGQDRQIMGLFAAHRDLPFISDEISYGLFLAEHAVLDTRESELVILPAIMCQNLEKETSWHLRGCVRAGISREDVELVQQAIEMVAEFAGRRLDRVPRVKDVED